MQIRLVKHAALAAADHHDMLDLRRYIFAAARVALFLGDLRLFD